MTNQDAKEYFTRLMEILMRQKLDWVVAEVNNTIRLGKLRSKKLRVEEDLWVQGEARNVLEPGTGKKSPQKFTVSEPYTAQEELRILVTAISSLTVDLAAVERRTVRLVERSGRKAHAEEFTIDPIIYLHDENTDRPAWQSAPASRGELNQLASKIRPLIDELRKELDAS